MNHAPDHHFHGHPEKRFTLQDIKHEIVARHHTRRPKPDPKHWKMKPKKGPKNAA